MSELILLDKLRNVNTSEHVNKQQIVEEIIGQIAVSDYNLEDVDTNRPWGAFFRLKNADAERFVAEFFPEIDLNEARLGDENIEISPKILLVSPNQRLSWQYHNYRAERWSFLTEGAYHRSLDDEMGEVIEVMAGESVQFAPGERHRLVGRTTYALVAEIWQHTDSTTKSSEDDIVRLHDDYSR